MRPLRDTDPSKIRIVTIRTTEARLFMTPSEEINKTIGGIIAKYQGEYGIVIYAYKILSNHYHLLIQSPNENLWRFEAEVNREIAHRVNRKLNRHGFFWGRRYDEQKTLEVSDAEDALLYVTTNDVRHGLVSHPREWPGLNCYHHLLDEKDRVYPFINHTKYAQAKLLAKKTGEKVLISDFQTEHTLKISRLPQFQGLSAIEYRAKISTLIEERVQLLHETRAAEGVTGFLGRRKILSQDPFSTPKEVSLSPRPTCYTKNPEAKKLHDEEELARVAAYKIASKKFRSGQYDVEFPRYSIPPPVHYRCSPH